MKYLISFAIWNSEVSAIESSKCIVIYGDALGRFQYTSSTVGSESVYNIIIVLAAQWHGGKTLGEVFVVDSAGSAAHVQCKKGGTHC